MGQSRRSQVQGLRPSASPAITLVLAALQPARSRAEMVSVSNRCGNELLDLWCRSIGSGFALRDDHVDIGVHGVPIIERTEEREEPTRPPRVRQVGTAIQDRTQLGNRPTVTQDHRLLTVLGSLEETAKVPLGGGHRQTIRLCHSGTTMSCLDVLTSRRYVGAPLTSYSAFGAVLTRALLRSMPGCYSC